MKNSRSRADAISWNSGLSSQRPTNRIAASTSTLFTSTQPNVGHTDWPPAPPSAGIKIRNGTTIRSWNSNTPKAWRPWREFCSSCSISSFMTMAVEDSASTPPMTIAPAAGTPQVPGDETEHGAADEHLRAAETEDGLLHGQELRQRELEADGEHQEYQAELGERARAGDVGDPAEPIGPDEHAGDEVRQ